MRKKWKQWQTLFSWAPIAADGDYSHDTKRCFLLERKAMTNLDNILKSRHITCLTKVHLIKAMVFPVVLYGYESWMKKKAEPWRIDALNCGAGEDSWVPWIARRSNQSILKKSILNIHWKDWCWSWSSNTLATWCKEPIHWKNLEVGKNWGQEEKRETEDEIVGWHHWLNGREF